VTLEAIARADNMSSSEIGVTIKRLREEKGWTELALAKRAKNTAVVYLRVGDGRQEESRIRDVAQAGEGLS
jgi:transcriptional regulator with XRE-family HTH domain